MRARIGQYRIEAALGRGGMGVVYHGVHENLGREVAVKALAPELTQQPEFKERFFSEAKTQARLQHPNIVGVYDLLEDGGEYFIVMEFVAGEGLDGRMRSLAGRPMDLREALPVFGQMLAALDYAHAEGVVHRDIKPSNVLITANGRVKLTDFGIALLVGDKRLTASQTIIGTPTYMSPEQIVRPKSVDHRADIYSAAVVFFEMLAGRPPFDDETEYGIKKRHVETPPPDLVDLRADLSPELSQAVARALAKDPDERYPTAGAFQAALQAATPPWAIPTGVTPMLVTPVPAARPAASTASYAVPHAAPPETTRASTPAAGKNRWILLGAAALLAVAVGLGGLFFFLRPQSDSGAAVAQGGPAAPAAGMAHASASPPLSAETPAVPGAQDALQVQPTEPPPATSVAPVAEAPPAAPKKTSPPPEKTKTSSETPGKKPPASAPPSEAPAAAPPEPAAAPAPAPAPDKDQPSKGKADNGAALDPFNEMDEVIINIEDLSKKAMKAYEDADLDTDLGPKLESFTEGAIALRREFRTATGTGVRGTLGTLKESLRRRGGGREVDTRKLEIKAKELLRQSKEVEGLVGGQAEIADYWREIRRNLKRLEGFFP